MDMHTKIKAISSYHPSNVVNNEEIISDFNAKGIDIRNLLESTGKKNRYISNDNAETSFTMAVKVCKDVLVKANLTAKDIDYIIYASDSPEYLVPTNSMLIHTELEGKQSCGLHDMNSNCLGLINAVYIINGIMSIDSSVSRALIVGSQQLTHYGDSPAVKGMLGDSACAFIVERTESTESGFIDTIAHTEPTYATEIYFPSKGLSGLKDIAPEIDWRSQRNPGRAFYHASIDIDTMIERSHINKSDIKKYFISQMTIKEIDLISKDLNEPIDKFPYIGDKVGYTGLTSPFLVLEEAIDNNEIERGDYIILWSIGAGLNERGILLRY